MTFPVLYKRTTDGAIQTWRQEVDGDKYRSISGQLNGKEVTSEWRVATPKNVGKKNATTAEQQAIAEVEANYKKRRELNYVDNIEDVDGDFFFAPMLAKNYEDYPINFAKQIVYSQPKLDGIRCIIKSNGAWSRKGKRIVSIPHILEALEPLFMADPDLVLDGELYNHEFKDNFNELVSIARQAKPTPLDIEKSRKYMQYHVYDMAGEERFDLRFNKVLELIGKGNIPYVFAVGTSNAHCQRELDVWNGHYTEAGYEGQMVRIASEGYENKRSKNLLKRKEFDETEFEIVRIEAGDGNRSHVAGRCICKHEDGREFGSGIKGSFDFAAELLANADKYVGGTVTVRHFKRTPDGIPRFPVAKAFFPGERDV